MPCEVEMNGNYLLQWAKARSNEVSLLQGEVRIDRPMGICDCARAMQCDCARAIELQAWYYMCRCCCLGDSIYHSLHADVVFMFHLFHLLSGARFT